MNPLRPLTITLTAAVATSLFLAMPIPYPPAVPGEFLDWWAAEGTPTATVAMLRLGVLAATIYVSATGALATVAALLRVRLPDGLLRGLPASLRRWLVGAAVAGIVAAPTAAAASTASALAGPEAPSADFALVDMGPVAAQAVPGGPGPARAAVPGDLGPTTGQAASGDFELRPLSEADDSASALAADADEAEVWTVRPGDHLWSIAAETVAERTGSADTDDVWRYWRSLIAANSQALDDNPDVIHPGTRISLPAS